MKKSAVVVCLLALVLSSGCKTTTDGGASSMAGSDGSYGMSVAWANKKSAWVDSLVDGKTAAKKKKVDDVLPINVVFDLGAEKQVGTVKVHNCFITETGKPRKCKVYISSDEAVMSLGEKHDAIDGVDWDKVADCDLAEKAGWVECKPEKAVKARFVRVKLSNNYDDNLKTFGTSEIKIFP